MPTRLHLSLAEAIRHWSIYEPNRAAVVTETATITYRELQRHITEIGRRLIDHQLPRQSRIAIITASKHDFLATTCAVLAAGHSVVVIHPSASTATLERMLQDANVAQVLKSDEITAAIHTSAGHTEEQLIDVSAIRYVDDVWGIIYSSGTTGRPKGIVRSDLSMLTELLGWCLELPLKRGVSMYVARPVYYTGGLVLAAATLLVGGTVIGPTEHTFDIYAELAASWRIDYAFFVPDQLPDLLRFHAQHSGHRAPETIVTMGARVPTHLKQQVAYALKCGVIESWGNSEGLGTIADREDVTKRPSSIGRPFITDQMFILTDRGDLAGPNVIGRIVGRSDSTLTAYHNRADLSHLLRDGLVVTEDIGYYDKDGYFYIAGRVTERLLRRGQPVFTSEIEGTLRDTLGLECAVAGVHHPDDGQAPVAVIVAASGTDPEQLRATANAALDPQHQLNAIRIVSALPKTGTGKLDYGAVTAMFASERSVQERINTMKTALLVIDAQKVYTEKGSELYCKDSKATLKRVNLLIEAFAKRGEPIIFVRHTHREDGSDLGRMFDYAGEAPADFNFKEHSQEVEYSDGLTLPKDHREITKHRYSAFAGTGLDEMLRRDCIGRVAICGFMTNFCCESTAREAHDRDYFVDFVVDATGTPGTENLDEKKIRTVVGELLSAGYANVSKTDEYVAKLRGK